MKYGRSVRPNQKCRVWQRQGAWRSETFCRDTRSHFPELSALYHMPLCTAEGAVSRSPTDRELAGYVSSNRRTYRKRNRHATGGSAGPELYDQTVTNDSDTLAASRHGGDGEGRQ